MIHGQNVAITDLGFDDGGTWTHKPYTGSYGTRGFRLDGTNGYISQVNAYDFTANDPDLPPLDTVDLPPYTL
jgi:hypothetical protein